MGRLPFDVVFVRVDEEIHRRIGFDQRRIGLQCGQKLDTRNNRDFGGAMIRFVVDGVSGAIWVG